MRLLNDIKIAKEILINEDLALVVVKNGEIVYKSKDKGIKPLYTLATEMKEEAKGSSLADRIIGKGAALLCGYMEVDTIYTDLISEGGIKTLEQYRISYSMEKSCPYIKNRDKTDYCPIEKLSLDTEDPIILLEKIEAFFKSINQ
ncbi:DUF1893 domain-containing protein [Tissierella sp. MB52-C2]|uniref:DUF1893 domain-containing protein n=1 Tax=Tissierella sp. MB52-C2 TaxID=3070999 RepID=UPI0035AC0087